MVPMPNTMPYMEKTGRIRIMECFRLSYPLLRPGISRHGFDLDGLLVFPGFQNAAVHPGLYRFPDCRRLFSTLHCRLQSQISDSDAGVILEAAEDSICLRVRIIISSLVSQVPPDCFFLYVGRSNPLSIVGRRTFPSPTIFAAFSRSDRQN
jgi:hypothetical protein